jgi:cysteine-rich repeat protein
MLVRMNGGSGRVARARSLAAALAFASAACGGDSVTLRPTLEGKDTTQSAVSAPSCPDDCSCGDGIVTPDEECEPPGTPSCDAQCHRIRPGCGNAVLDEGEECEDGNAKGGDGCSADCRTEACGNSRIDSGEDCEPPGTPRCSAACRVLPLAACGNGIREPGEECEDGNAEGGDGCGSTCSIEACGNGRIEFGETCEPPSSDSCNVRCQLIPAATRRGACGNGIAEPDEECDDGNTLDADGCSGGCELEVCGNGRLDPAELCEPPDTATCDNRCYPRIVRCGDRTLAPGEECDDGNIADGDGCNARCELEACGNGRLDLGEACEPPGTPICGPLCQRITAYCGNRFIDVGEECDDGNVILGDGCDTRCQLEYCGNGRLDPSEDCELPGTPVCDEACHRIGSRCGDGSIGGAEECDDGNLASGDGCGGACELEVCGNGRIDALEQCEPPGTATCGLACELLVTDQ